MKDFYEILQGRRSVKYYNSEVKIDREELVDMLDMANRAPSFYNFQPWRYIVVDTPEGKEKLGQANYNKVQNDSSAAVVIVLADLNYFDKFDHICTTQVEEGYLSPEIKEKTYASVEKLINSLDEQTQKELLNYDCGLWSMQFANVAYAKGYDTNILAGFNKKKLVEVFDIDSSLMPIVLISVGKKERDGHPTTRLSAESLVSFE